MIINWPESHLVREYAAGARNARCYEMCRATSTILELNHNFVRAVISRVPLQNFRYILIAHFSFSQFSIFLSGISMKVVILVR